METAAVVVTYLLHLNSDWAGYPQEPLIVIRAHIFQGRWSCRHSINSTKALSQLNVASEAKPRRRLLALSLYSLIIIHNLGFMISLIYVVV